MTATPQPDPTASDPELEEIVLDERRCLERVTQHLLTKGRERPEVHVIDYDTQLISLRDQIANARLEDVPPLVEQMERVATLASRQRVNVEGWVDPTSPYFGRMVLSENERTREVLIGRSTYLDTQSGVRIVDWRDAPISRLYYRYEEGEDYAEVFGEREVEGDVVVRRSLAITEGVLRRIVSPQGTFVCTDAGQWRRSGASTKLAGGQGAALRAEDHHRPGKLGVQASDGREDKHLKEITALIDPRQFDLITRPDAGLVVIQGGAGSGKTTIGLHRLAYLAFQDARRFRPDKMLVVVFNDALARYVARVLPALGVSGVAVRTYEEWASKLRLAHVSGLPRHYSDDTPNHVTRLKKHPLMLTAMDEYAQRLSQRIRDELAEALGSASEGEAGTALLGSFDPPKRRDALRPLAHRIHGAETQLKKLDLPGAARLGAESVLRRAAAQARDVVSAWAEILSDLPALRRLFQGNTDLTPAELERAHAWAAHQTGLVTEELEQRQEAAAERAERLSERAPRERDAGSAERYHGERERSERARSRAELGASEDDEQGVGRRAIDGGEVEEVAKLDREDDTLLLYLVQQLRGPLLRGKGGDALVYEHALIDEAQDLSPVELSVLIGTVSRARSVTLAGDVAQRLHMDNGFKSWEDTLAQLHLDHVEVEPLKLSYRSTREVLEFAREVLGPLASAEEPVATRAGAKVELFRFAQSGDAVGFLAESLRSLMAEEPSATVCLVARYPEQADLYYNGLKRAEVPFLRRIAHQDFPFRAGVDVTDVRQVKGLEFDYVVLLDVTQSSYPEDDESRHLLHIAATRAAHQLWVIAPGKPSALLPAELRERGY
ncbi:MAG: ATP-binding domain-containing protein [Polyangiaceae bacterium]|nr:ATP-binding domain-containing protein [Polyangiaceae bacterium]MCW5791173.1 ATP-binding domain-containing protein [Polyangiaceae bacterium]